MPDCARHFSERCSDRSGREVILKCVLSYNIPAFPVQHDAAAEGCMNGRAPLLKAAEIAKWLCVSVGWVNDHATGRRKPVLPSKKLGKARRFIEADVEEWLRKLNGERAA